MSYKEIGEALLAEKEIVEYDYRNNTDELDTVRFYWYTDDPTEDSEGYIAEQVIYLHSMNKEELAVLLEYCKEEIPWEYAAYDNKNTRTWIEDVVKGDTSAEAIGEHFHTDVPYEVFDIEKFIEIVRNYREAIA